ncbi:MAG: hypothetical protein RLZZ303_2727 [Candidatus Hydrogenedentota bacterium]|jgi:hypothetical protein
MMRSAVELKTPAFASEIVARDSTAAEVKPSRHVAPSAFSGLYLPRWVDEKSEWMMPIELRRLLRHVPTSVSSSFTCVQLLALAQAAMIELPSAQEAEQDFRKQKKKVPRLLLSASILVCLSVAFAAAGIALYLIKSAMKIDIFEGPSFLHNLVF